MIAIGQVRQFNMPEQPSWHALKVIVKNGPLQDWDWVVGDDTLWWQVLEENGYQSTLSERFLEQSSVVL